MLKLIIDSFAKRHVFVINISDLFDIMNDIYFVKNILVISVAACDIEIGNFEN